MEKNPYLCDWVLTTKLLRKIQRKPKRRIEIPMLTDFDRKSNHITAL